MKKGTVLNLFTLIKHETKHIATYSDVPAMLILYINSYNYSKFTRNLFFSFENKEATGKEIIAFKILIF